jgi:hypothetical protein
MLAVLINLSTLEAEKVDVVNDLEPSPTLLDPSSQKYTPTAPD